MIITFLSTYWISITGSILGLIYLYLEYKANIWMWLASILMAIFYIYIFYSTQLYASMSIYIYFLCASVYGWISWLRKKQKDAGANTIHTMPRKFILYILSGIIIAFGVIYIILKFSGTDQGIITIGDAFTTSLNIIALWMASRKWAEQWLPLIPANLLSSILLFAQGDIFSCILFAIFCIVSIAGYYNWKKMSTKN